MLYLNNQIRFELALSKLHRMIGTVFQGKTPRTCWGFSCTQAALHVSCHYAVIRNTLTRVHLWFRCCY